MGLPSRPVGVQTSRTWRDDYEGEDRLKRKRLEGKNQKDKRFPLRSNGSGEGPETRRKDPD